MVHFITMLTLNEIAFQDYAINFSPDPNGVRHAYRYVVCGTE